MYVRGRVGTILHSHLLIQPRNESFHKEYVIIRVLRTSKKIWLCTAQHPSTITRKCVCWICYFLQTCFCWSLDQHNKARVELLHFCLRKKECVLERKERAKLPQRQWLKLWFRSSLKCVWVVIWFHTYCNIPICGTFLSHIWHHITSGKQYPWKVRDRQTDRYHMSIPP